MNIKVSRVALLVVVGLVLCSSIAAAYTNPFRVRVRTSYPLQVRTVGQAANHLLAAIDYKVIYNLPAPQEAREIGRMGIGPLARTGEVMPMEDALLLLVGEQNCVVVDHEHSLVTFERCQGGAQ